MESSLKEEHKVKEMKNRSDNRAKKSNPEEKDPNNRRPRKREQRKQREMMEDIIKEMCPEAEDVGPPRALQDE